jgi:hypothetical protein
MIHYSHFDCALTCGGLMWLVPLPSPHLSSHLSSEQRTHSLSLHIHTDVSCSGHGSCVSTAKLFQLFGLSYGNVTTDYIKAGGPNWDAFSWHHCLCSANLAAGFLGDPLRPSVGPRYVRTCSLCALCCY